MTKRDVGRMPVCRLGDPRQLRWRALWSTGSSDFRIYERSKSEPVRIAKLRLQLRRARSSEHVRPKVNGGQCFGHFLTSLEIRPPAPTPTRGRAVGARPTNPTALTFDQGRRPFWYPTYIEKWDTQSKELAREMRDSTLRRCLSD